MPDPHINSTGLWTRKVYTIGAGANVLPSAAASVNEILYVSDQQFGPNCFGCGASSGPQFFMRMRSDGSQWRVETCK